MWKSVIIALALAACGGSKAKPTEKETPTTGGEGAVCGCGERSEGNCVAVECDEGLVCGYGCGVPGCDDTCMTPEQFEHSKTIP